MSRIFKAPSTFIVLTLLLSLLTLFSSSSTHPSSSILLNVSGSADDVVVDLNPEAFKNFIQGELVLVEFFAPWCGHCRNLAPEYARASVLLQPTGIQLGKVDATIYTALAAEYNVKGYPTLKVFRKGVEEAYGGTRKADGIVEYMKKLAPPMMTLSTKAATDAPGAAVTIQQVGAREHTAPLLQSPDSATPDSIHTVMVSATPQFDLLALIMRLLFFIVMAYMAWNFGLFLWQKLGGGGGKKATKFSPV